MKEWPVVRFHQWMSTLDQDNAPRSINWWLRARVMPQHRAYDENLTPEVRRNWGAVVLSLTECAERFAGYDRWEVAADDFNLRGLLIRKLGSVPDDENWELGALVRSVLAIVTLTPGQASEMAEHWRTLPTDQIHLLRRHKIVLTPLALLADQVLAGPEAEDVRAWLSIRPSLP
ncbi:hypothetical protein KRMM14A1259_18600 [Krasilnikovia sp. MM14-A1259]